MWEGENGQIHHSQFVNHQQDSANFSSCMGGSHGNNLDNLNTGAILNPFPNSVLLGQAENNALFSPQIMQHSSFQKSREFYQSGHSEIISTNIVPQDQCGVFLNHQGISVDVDQETMFRSPGLPYGNIGMISSYDQSENFWDIDNIHGVKRKADEDYSPLYCGAKRRITDERMATGMNSLSITNDHNYCDSTAMFNPNDDLNMQFSATSNEMHDNADQEKRKENPVFHFTAPLEQMLKKKINILPTKIIQEICKPCLAMVPWSPPLHTKSQIIDEQQEKKVKNKTLTQDEMEDDNFIS